MEKGGNGSGGERKMDLNMVCIDGFGGMDGAYGIYF